MSSVIERTHGIMTWISSCLVQFSSPLWHSSFQLYLLIMHFLLWCVAYCWRIFALIHPFSRCDSSSYCFTQVWKRCWLSWIISLCLRWYSERKILGDCLVRFLPLLIDHANGRWLTGGIYILNYSTLSATGSYLIAQVTMLVGLPIAGWYLLLKKEPTRTSFFDFLPV